jgi:hypothetical protein
MGCRALPKLARYQTALRPALGILRCLGQSATLRKVPKREHLRILRPNLVATASHEVRSLCYKQIGPKRCANTGSGPHHQPATAMIPIPTEAERILQAAAARSYYRSRSGPEVPSPPSARNHSKRHSVNRECSREERQRSARARKSAAEARLRRQQYNAVVRAYYAGATPDLSALSRI